MFRLFLILVIVFSLFKVSFSVASECGPLFSNVESSSTYLKNIREAFDKIFLDKELIEKINSIKENTTHFRTSKMKSSQQYVELLQPLYSLIYNAEIPASISYILKLGVNNLSLDLLDPHSRRVNTWRIIHENFAMTNILLAQETLRLPTTDKKSSSNLISMSPEISKANRELVDARRKIFTLIDSYKFENSISDHLKRQRLVILFDADYRFRSLPTNQKLRIIEEMMTSFKEEERFISSELVLSTYLKSAGEPRT